MPTTYAIIKGNQYMDATLYTGTGAAQSIVNAGGFSPDLVWIKSRSNAQSHSLFDVIRGAGFGLFSNSTSAELNNTANFTSFNSNGFSLASNGGDTNASGFTYVAWQWRASDSAAVTNTAGSITSTVSANTTARFSVVTYTGNGTGGATIGHGLGAVPSMVIYKRRSDTENWGVYHISTGNDGACFLNLTNAKITNSAYFNNTSPTSTLLTVGGNNAFNGSGSTYVAYCWSEVPGYSKFGSYVGNGNADGTFVYTGFRPEFVLYKCSSTSGGFWCITDGTRNPSNLANFQLFPNSSSAEATGGSSDQPLDLLSNGFKLRGTGGAGNLSGETYIYMAFAEMPTTYANAR
jgi:hypothetical protein